MKVLSAVGFASWVAILGCASGQNQDAWVDTASSFGTGGSAGADLFGGTGGAAGGDVHMGGNEILPLPFPKTCAEAQESKTSVGCTFFPLHLPGHWGAAFIAGNVSSQHAKVTLANADGVVGMHDLSAGLTGVFNASDYELPDETTIVPFGYVIESTQPIQVNQLIPPIMVPSNDASLVIPQTGLGTRHRIVTYNDQFNDHVRQYVAVAATEDDTTVTFTLQQPGSTTLASSDGMIPALDKDVGPESTTATLNRLEVLVIVGGNTDPKTGQLTNELTGSLVTSDKPVAVYSGNNHSFVPAGCGMDCCCGDLIGTSVPPTTAYGKTYAGVKLLPIGDEADVWRFIADHDDTQITLQGDENTSISLAEGEFTDILSKGVFTVSANHPIGVAHLMSGGMATGLTDPGLQPWDCDFTIPYPGDPALTWVYPKENWLHRYTMVVGASLTAGSWCHDHVTVVAEQSAWHSITLDGEALPPPTTLASSSLGYAYIPVDDGGHELIAPPEVAVEVTVYGYLNFGSYLFPGGMGFRELNPIKPPR